MNKITSEQLKQEMEKAQSRLFIDQLEKRLVARVLAFFRDHSSLRKLALNEKIKSSSSEILKKLDVLNQTFLIRFVEFQKLIVGIPINAADKHDTLIDIKEDQLLVANKLIFELERLRTQTCKIAYEKGFYITPSDEILPLQ